MELRFEEERRTAAHCFFGLETHVFPGGASGQISEAKRVSGLPELLRDQQLEVAINTHAGILPYRKKSPAPANEIQICEMNSTAISFPRSPRVVSLTPGILDLAHLTYVNLQASPLANQTPASMSESVL